MKTKAELAASYVRDALDAVQQRIPGVAISPGSNVRAIIEAAADAHAEAMYDLYERFEKLGLTEEAIDKLNARVSIDVTIPTKEDKPSPRRKRKAKRFRK